MPGYSTRLTCCFRLCRRLVVERTGADYVEYALLAGFFGLAVFIGFSNLETTINTAYSLWDGAVQAIWEPPDPAGGGS